MDNITLEQIVKTISTVTIISAFILGIYKWYKSKISDRLDKLETKVCNLEKDSKKNKEENALLLKGQLACLKGLQEQGCNGPVTQSINEIESYLLKQAHK